MAEERRIEDFQLAEAARIAEDNRIADARLVEEALISEAEHAEEARLREKTRAAGAKAKLSADIQLAEEAKKAVRVPIDTPVSRPTSVLTLNTSSNPVTAALAAQLLLQNSNYAMWFGFKYQSYFGLGGSAGTDTPLNTKTRSCPLSPVEVYYAPFLRAQRVTEYVQTVVSSRGSNLFLAASNALSNSESATKMLTSTSSSTTYGTFDTSSGFMALTLSAAAPSFSPSSARRPDAQTAQWQSMEYLLWALFQLYGKVDGVLVKTVK